MHSSIRRLLFGLGAVLALARPATAQLVYGTAYSGPSANASLYSVNPATGAGTLIGALGATGLKQLGAIDFNPINGLLYGIGSTGTSLVLATINTSSGASTVIGNTGAIDPFQDLAFSSSGTLYGTSGGSLYTINITTGAASLVGLGDTLQFFGDGLQFGPGGLLYYANDSELSTVNTATGDLSLIASLSFGAAIDPLRSNGPRVTALGFYAPTNTMYASVFSGSPGGGDLITYFSTVNLTTGLVTSLGTTIAGLDAIAVRAIPEPSTLALTGSGLAALLLAKRLRKRRSRA